MNTLDAIASLTARIGIVRQQIDRHRQSILDLEAEAQRLAIALGVMQQLEASNVDGSAGASADVEVKEALLSTYSSGVYLPDHLKSYGDPKTERFKVPFVTQVQASSPNLASMPPTTKHLIKSLFVADKLLSRVDVLTAVKKQKPDANDGTVATTLSKLMSEGYLTRERNLYKRKDGIASGDDTGDADDLL